LVTTAVLLLVYVGYLLVHGLPDDRAVGARRAAVLGIVGFADLPVVHFSVVWWRTLHQPPTLLSIDPAPIDPRMLAALLTALLAFTLAGAWVFRRRLRMLAAADAEAARPATADVPEQRAEPQLVLPVEPLVVPRVRS
jgi:heme exporter protein C